MKLKTFSRKQGVVSVATRSIRTRRVSDREKFDSEVQILRILLRSLVGFTHYALARGQPKIVSVLKVEILCRKIFLPNQFITRQNLNFNSEYGFIWSYILLIYGISGCFGASVVIYVLYNFVKAKVMRSKIKPPPTTPTCPRK